MNKTVKKVNFILTMADPICFYNREFIQISTWGTACLDNLNQWKKYMVITHFISGGWISNVGEEQIVFAKEIVGNSPLATQNLQ
jgi:hypothetical protein